MFDQILKEYKILVRSEDSIAYSIGYHEVLEPEFEISVSSAGVLVRLSGTPSQELFGQGRAITMGLTRHLMSSYVGPGKVTLLFSFDHFNVLGASFYMSRNRHDRLLRAARCSNG